MDSSRHHIFGFFGPKGSGKSTAAKLAQDYITDVHKVTCLRTAYSGPMKAVAAEMYGWDKEMLAGYTPESRQWREQVDPFWGITPRQAIIDMVTSVRAIREDHWIRLWARYITDYLKDAGDDRRAIIVEDARMKTELHSLVYEFMATTYFILGPKPDWWMGSQATWEETVSNRNVWLLRESIPPNVDPTESEWIASLSYARVIPNLSSIDALKAAVADAIDTRLGNPRRADVVNFQQWKEANRK